MSLRERTYTFAEEIERIEQERRDLARKAAQLSDGDPRKKKLIAEGNELDAQLNGLRWARTAHEDDDVDVWNDAAEGVTLAGLTGSEFGGLQDEIEQDGRAGSGTTRVTLVADATVEAPYVDDSMDDVDRTAAVGSLPVPYLKWAESRIDELVSLSEGNEQDFADLLLEMQAEET